MWEAGEHTFSIVAILSGSDGWQEAFNFYFTLVWVFGMIAAAIALMLKVLTRS